MKARFYFVFIRTIACSILLFASILFESGCGKNPSNSEETETGMIIDIDGNVYRTVRIGDQEWMAENLKVTHYRNGEEILNVWEDSEWRNASTGAWCDYVNNSDIAAIYGRLYNWYALNDTRNLAPEGWHVPTDADWKELELYLGMNETVLDASGLRGLDEGDELKSTSGWNEDGNGTNKSGFSALPAGDRIYYGRFSDLGEHANFWASTESSEKKAWYRSLSCWGPSISRNSVTKQVGYSVRCVKD